MQQRRSDGPPIFELALSLLQSLGRSRPIVNGAILKSSAGRTVVTVYHQSLDPGNVLEFAFGTAELAKLGRIEESAVLGWITRARETLGRPAKAKFSQKWPRVGVSDETQLRAVAASLVALVTQDETSGSALDKRFALVTLDGDVVYPWKKSERSTGRRGFAISAPGRRDAHEQADYTESIEDVVRRVVFDGWSVRVRSETNPARFTSPSMRLGGSAVKGYWVAATLRSLVEGAAIQPLNTLPASTAGRATRDSRAESHEHALTGIASVTAERYADVLAELDATLTPAQREMLVGHARAPGATLSMQKLAELGGYAGYEAANLQYGLLGGKVAAALGISGLENQVQALCDLASDSDGAGHAQWKLRQPILEAMQELELVPGDSQADDASRATADGIDEDIRDRPPTTRQALIQARLGQGAYRKKMLRWWGGGCAVTGCTVPEAIVASHVLPWKDANDEQRLDHLNGLPLVGTLDRLFDSGLISFSDTGVMLLSTRLQAADLEQLGLRAGSRLSRTDPRLVTYLREHRRRYGFDVD